MRKRTLPRLALSLAIATATEATAEGTWTFGAVVDAETGVYVGQNDQATLIPYISYETERLVFSLHDGLSYRVLQGEGPDGQTGEVSVLLAPRWTPDFGKGPIFDGLDRDVAIEAGIAGRYEAGLFFFEGEALIDISDTHKGYEAKTFAGVQYETGRFQFEAGLGARHRSSDLNQHLFGVASSEVTATRAAFAPGSTTTAFASLTGVYLLRKNLALVGDIKVEDLGDLDASPLVDKSSNTSLTLGVLYQF